MIRSVAVVALLLALAGSHPALAQFCAPPAAFNAPQKTLATEKLVIVGRGGEQHVFSVEMALTPDQQEVGLMMRPTVPADGGMLFDMGMPPQVARFWMCNTIASLDMVFIKPDGTIDSIVENAVPQSLAEDASRGPVRGVLELAAGTTARLGIRVGDKVRQRIFGNAG